MNPAYIGAAMLLASAFIFVRRTSPASLVPDVAADLGAYLSVNVGGVVGVIPHDQEILARTMWGEARGLGRAGMENVASVIMNRYNARRRGQGYVSWGPIAGTVAQICQAPKQFSCWNANDPNLALLRQVTDADPQFREALQIAGQAIAGNLFDRTGGADHYFASAIDVPSWARGVASIFEDAGHTFKKLIG